MATDQDRVYMQLALEQAKQAQLQNEVPVGAIVVLGGQVIGYGYNQPVGCHDPSAHAEIVALRNAAMETQNYRLTGSTLYVTLEPCIMCAGAILHARVDRLVFGCRDPRAGAAGSKLNLLESDFLPHQTAIEAGVLEAGCSELLRGFFQARR